ncbi:hypothetical protein RDI58_022230 [Solanum bulbocastanum]|uniref:Uncharacterized protein n=1 Tax=Solanum bulbocastanum TaxID=147425 RepID=A0AAN8T7F3_SOLBU
MTTTFPYINWSLNWRDLLKQRENCLHETRVQMDLGTDPQSNGSKLTLMGAL